MSRPWHTWLAFALCLAVVLGAMAWVSATVLRLERAERQAQQAAEREENVRLALWRMDSALAPVIAAESARPYFVYRSFYPLDRSFGNMFNKDNAAIVMPSPLLTQTPAHVLLHFQIDAGGNLTSPQVPGPDMRAIAQSRYASPEHVRAAAARLDGLKAFLNPKMLLALLPKETSASAAPIRIAPAVPRAAAQPAPQTQIPAPQAAVRPEPQPSTVAPLEPVEKKSVVIADNSGLWSQRDNRAWFNNDAPLSAGNNVPRANSSEWQESRSQNEQRFRNRSYGQNWEVEREIQTQQAAQFAANNVMCNTRPAPKSVDAEPNAKSETSKTPVDAQIPQSSAPANSPAMPVEATVISKDLPIKTPVTPSPQQSGSAARANDGPARASVSPPLQRTDTCAVPALDVQILQSGLPESSEVAEGAAMPIWFGDNLVIARRCRVKNQLFIHGCWLNWSGMRKSLLADVRDLLPQAELLPVSSEWVDKSAYMLAALPARLVPGNISTGAAPVWTPLRVSLVVAWSCVLVAALAVAALLLGALSLSERRGAFVSAVTHELRTPLTTFRMYTEMLAAGMIPDESRRQKYLHTLRVEAERLSHLVENVLAYARIERGRSGNRLETVALGAVLDKGVERLAERAAQAGMKLDIERGGGLAALSVRTDPSAVEQILFNLVDNACKYAGSGSSPVIRIETARESRFAVVRVCDHGAGFSKKDSRMLFQPFSKSASEAARSAPGVGLGLALSRRLARQMGGDLRLDATAARGACLVLTLPLA